VGVIVKFGILLMFGTLGLVGCNEKPTAPTAAPSVSVALAAPSAAPARSTSRLVTPPDDKASADTWLVVSKGAVELGTIELRSGNPPKLALVAESADGTELKKKLAAVGGPNGIGLDMHLPPPSGKGRGPYGTQIVKYDDPLYRHALKEELEPEYSVREVKRLFDGMPPEKIKKLTAARSGQKMGSIDFSSNPPKLTLATPETGDVMGLRNNFDRIKEMAEVRVRFHYEKDGKETLVDQKAKPGDPSYAQTVALWLIIERDYRKRYAYEVEYE
jgi:hypothetical protein